MTHVHVVAGIIWKAGCFLAARRCSGKSGAGFWEFPGGKIEAGESKEDALVRELKEELGIVAHRFCFWKEEAHEYPDYSVTLYFFHVLEYSNEPMLIEGHDALAWVKPGELGTVEFLAADAQILAELGQMDTSEIFDPSF